MSIPIAIATNLADISESTIYKWFALAKKKGPNKIYKDLVEKVYEAFEFSNFEALQILLQATLEGSNWRAAACILERRHTEKKRKRSRKMKNRSNK